MIEKTTLNIFDLLDNCTALKDELAKRDPKVEYAFKTHVKGWDANVSEEKIMLDTFSGFSEVKKYLFNNSCLVQNKTTKKFVFLFDVLDYYFFSKDEDDDE